MPKLMNVMVYTARAVPIVYTLSYIGAPTP
jgi:hypothetical protein